MRAGPAPKPAIDRRAGRGPLHHFLRGRGWNLSLGPWIVIYMGNSSCCPSRRRRTPGLHRPGEPERPGDRPSAARTIVRGGGRKDVRTSSGVHDSTQFGAGAGKMFGRTEIRVSPNAEFCVELLATGSSKMVAGHPVKGVTRSMRNDRYLEAGPRERGRCVVATRRLGSRRPWDERRGPARISGGIREDGDPRG